jgi:hypothetical protein
MDGKMATMEPGDISLQVFVAAHDRLRVFSKFSRNTRITGMPSS